MLDVVVSSRLRLENRDTCTRENFARHRQLTAERTRIPKAIMSEMTPESIGKSGYRMFLRLVRK